MQNYTPDEFISKLSEGALPADRGGVTVGGLVKVDEGSPSTLSFSSTLSCQNWTPIPLDMVESIDHVRMVACKDHEHPLVRIRLKPPEESRSDLALLQNVVSELQSFIASSLSGAHAGRPRKSVQDASDDCAIVSTEDDLLLCCMDADNEVNCVPVLKALKPD